MEIAEEDIHDFVTSILKKQPLITSAPKVIALPIPWSTHKNSFSISKDRSFQKKVSVLQLYELFISSPNIKKITRAITWRNAYSLIVTLDLEALPIHPAFVSKAYQVFKTLQKQEDYKFFMRHFFSHPPRLIHNLKCFLKRCNLKTP